MAARDPADQVLRTTCNRDCPDACGILATVRDGQVVSLRGDPDHPVTRGFLCYRTSRFVEQQNAPERLRQPLLRVAGELRPVSMAEALDHAADRLRRIRAESGPAAILHYRSGGSLGLLKPIADRFFESFGPCTGKVGDICNGAGEAAQLADFGVSESNDLFDLEHSRTIVLWGKNPFVSNVHLVPLLKKASAGGARIVSIDPVHHQGHELADTVLQPRPGSDPWLVLGILGRMFATGRLDLTRLNGRVDGLQAFSDLVARHTVAECAMAADLPLACVQELADCFLAPDPVSILVGWGLQRRSNGGTTIRLLDALSALSGHLYRRGGGCSFYFGRRTGLETAAVSTGRMARSVREPLLGADILAAKDPPIRAIWVTAGNPVSMLPDSATVARAFENTEFVVVVDPFLTDTGRRADLVLPVPTLLEDDDLVGAYGHHWLSESRPVVPPPAGVLHEVTLFQELARRVGLAAEMAGSVDDWKARLLAGLAPQGIDLPHLRQNGAVRKPAAEVLFADGTVATANGKVQLVGELPASTAVGADRGSADYPFWLFSNSTRRSQASQWAGGVSPDRTWVVVHPATMPGRCAGETVIVESELAAVEAELRFDSNQRHDVAIMPKGGHYDRGQSANSLIPARTTDMGLGAAYLDCRVRIR